MLIYGPAVGQNNQNHKLAQYRTHMKMTIPIHWWFGDKSYKRRRQFFDWFLSWLQMNELDHEYQNVTEDSEDLEGNATIVKIHLKPISNSKGLTAMYLRMSWEALNQLYEINSSHLTLSYNLQKYTKDRGTIPSAVNQNVWSFAMCFI